jgi:signal transduction histidine kinase
MSISKEIEATIGKMLQWLVLVYQGITFLAIVIAVILAFQWIQTPFIGAFVEHSMVFNGVGSPSNSPEWELFKEVKWKDQLTAINGQPVRSALEMQEVLRQFSPGDTIPITVKTAEGPIKDINVTLKRFPVVDTILLLGLPLLIGLIYLAVSLWIFGMRRTEHSGRSFTLLASSLALMTGLLFNVYTSHYLTPIWALSIGILGGALIDLGLGFPQEARIINGRPYLRWLGYLVGCIITVMATPTMFRPERGIDFYPYWRALFGLAGFAMLFFIGVIIYRTFASNSPVVRNQSRMILFSTLSFLPMLGWLVYTLFFHQISFSPVYLLPTVLFPIAIGYTILRYRLLQTDYLLSRSVLYITLTIITVLSFGTVVVGISLLFGAPLAENMIVLILLVAGFTLALQPLRNRLQGMIDSLFFRGGQAYQERLQAFVRELTSAVELPDIIRVLRQYVTSAVLPGRLHIYVFDPLNDQYVASPDLDGRPSSDVRFFFHSQLSQMLKSERIPIYADPSNPPAELKAEQARLTLLGTYLYVPMQSGNRLTGWLALGLRRSGEAYSSHELTFLEGIADQAALAIERAQVVVNMQRNVQEMNAINRISQGVNITLAFDDVLELIYAQTSQIISGSDFHLRLFNQAGDYFYYAFCIENNDRLSSKENIPLPPRQGLGREVVRAGRSILTQDYVRECQIRNVVPSRQSIYAWMGVPLSSGAEVIGALSVSSSDPNVRYTQSQIDLLQAIANQTAGAIIKSRLLDETQKRAQQLSTLNDITRQLTSTLELEPLLQNILENAVGILNCEAGSLLLEEEQSDELVFKVTSGPVATNLIGTRMPRGSGIVGQAVQLRSPVIENNAQQSASRFAATDAQTGFTTRALLAVPLQVKDHVIGVVEVINRKDGLPFNEDDQTLLAAFAGQAAVAIENARLYTLTDQELSVRVEELSVMQRIDRELNASLETDRAMRITLEWAMRQSDMEAGFIGAVRDDGIQIIADQGYGDLLSQYKENLMPVDKPAIQMAVENGQAQQVTLDPAVGQDGIIPLARTQIVVPIRREVRVIGLIVMESVTAKQPDIGFLSRLSDHAAIAIANAQLYAQIDAANKAKSQFVSFVAHELKNPMASIKGYTELITGGMTGPINEMQAKFLDTVRSNVERMNTIVSDLSDLNKIEAGILKIDFKSIPVPDIIEEALRSLRRQIEEKGQTVNFEAPKNLPQIWADRNRMIQIVVNLISNANKYTPNNGEIFIGIEPSKHFSDANEEVSVVHLWVKDTGIGIPIEDQGKIFQQYFRTEMSKTQASGTGLGLNITKQLVEMQGGRIWFDSEVGAGTTFHFTVPVAEG